MAGCVWWLRRELRGYGSELLNFGNDCDNIEQVVRDLQPLDIFDLDG